MTDAPEPANTTTADAGSAPALLSAVLFAARLFGQAAQTEQLRTLLDASTGGQSKGGQSRGGPLDLAADERGVLVSMKPKDRPAKGVNG